MELQPVLLGDKQERAQGWLVVSDGAVRAILTPADRVHSIYFSFACDRRVRPVEGIMTFRNLSHASTWLAARLEPTSASHNAG